MHLRRASEISFDDTYRVPDIHAEGGLMPDFPISGTNGARSVANLAMRHIVAVLEMRCRGALTACLEGGESRVRPVAARLEHSRSAPLPALRLTGWVERVDRGTVSFRVTAEDARGRACEATIELAPI